MLLAASPASAASASAIISYNASPNLTFLGTRWTSKCIHLCCNLYRLQAGADSTMDTSWATPLGEFTRLGQLHPVESPIFTCNVKALQGQKWCAPVSNDWQSTQRKLECCNLRRLWLLGVSSATGSFPESLWNKTRSLSMQACQWNVTIARATCDKDKTASVLGRCAGASKKIRRSCPRASNISYIATMLNLTINYLSLSWI